MSKHNMIQKNKMNKEWNYRYDATSNMGDQPHKALNTYFRMILTSRIHKALIDIGRKITYPTGVTVT